MSCSHRKIEATFPHALFSLRQSNPRRPLAYSSPNEAIHPLAASIPQNEPNPHDPHYPLLPCPFLENEQNEATAASPHDPEPMTIDDAPNEPTASPLPLATNNWQPATPPPIEPTSAIQIGNLHPRPPHAPGVIMAGDDKKSGNRWALGGVSGTDRGSLERRARERL